MSRYNDALKGSTHMFRIASVVFAMHAGAIALLAQDAGTTAADPGTRGYIELAARYGPFAFAVLAGLGVIWLVKLTRDCADSDKPHVEALANTYKKFTVAAGLTALCFAGLGTYHWMKTEQSMQVLRGTIKDLTDYEQVDADNFYFKTEFKKQLIGDTLKYRNEHFIAIQDHPFAAGQEFEISYNKEGAKKRTTFKVKYGGPLDFRIDYNVDMDRYELKPATTTDSASLGFGFSNPFVVYAQTVPSPQPAMKTVAGTQAVDMNLVNLLQDARTPVGAKIDVLDKLRAMDTATLKRYAETVTKQESFSLTLIDLSRHSDKELSAKAKIVIEKSGAQAVVGQQLKSSDTLIRNAAEQTVFRVSKERATEILKEAPASTQKQLMAQVNSGEKQQILIPVGTSMGDRYLVSMDWDTRDTKISNCMNAKAQGSFGLSRADAKQTVSVNSKEDALKMADAIRLCGAKASFPNPVLKK